MKGSTISRLISRGIPSQHPQFLREAKRLEDEAGARSQELRSTAFLRGAALSQDITSSFEILKWLATGGRAIRLGLLRRVQIWTRGDSTFLAVQKPHWEVYRIAARPAGFFELLRREV